VEFSDRKKLRGLICLALAFVTVGIYWQVHGFDFVNYDDPDYVTENPMVRAGLTFKGIIWAFTHFYASNWHPLTWISHMLDSQLFGRNNAGGPHLVNVFLHAGNAILLFLLLHRLTAAPWRSAVVAGLFALHPLHVESVAWISERKDVLSTFFGFASLLFYAGYVQGAKAQNSKAKTQFWLALAWFVLSLMAKPMLVTLPFLMLLLDVWPLQRVETAGGRVFFSPQFGKLALEKWPWFALVAVSCATTLLAEKGAAASAESFPLKWRSINAIESYFWYFEKTFWPTKLAVFYPLETARPFGPFVMAVLFLVLGTVVTVATIRRRPFLLIGWLWFLGTLIPVIGFIQVGSQSMADRYSYVPMIGLLIAVVWWGHSALGDSRAKTAVAGLAAAVVLAVLATASTLQLRYWKNSLTLYEHALAVTRGNDTMLNNLGAALFDLGRKEEAIKMYRRAVEVSPNKGDVYKKLGLVLAKTGKPDEAIALYQKAVQVTPTSAELQYFLAEALVLRGMNDEALPHFSEAARLNPKNARYQNDLAATLVALGKTVDAMPHYTQAMQLEPSNAQYQNNFATAAARTGDANTAIAHYRAAIRDDPKFAEPYSNLGALLFLRQEYGEAAAQYSEAVHLNPTNAGIRFNAGLAFLKVGRFDEAREQLNEAARLRPDWPEPLTVQAWALATSSEDRVRNGAEAVRLAEKAAALAAHPQPATLNILAAAYAEAGRFDDALTTANQALDLAKQSGRTNLIGKLERAIEFYQSHKPLRESSPGN